MTRLAAVLAAALFCVPLFIGLGRTDLRVDEPIYAFASDSILATGDWLTPGAIPDERAAFLEKPPLKFWIVAAGIRSGLLPHNEFGQRFWDAAFGAAAFMYVFAIGVMVGGPLCGLIAAYTLFVHGPLIYEHGLRGNNMEAPLLLSYCGGIYHAIAWFEAADHRTGRRHALAVGAFFILGFMTKFVAALFLPMIFIATALVLPQWRRRMLEDWRSWLAAALLVVVLTAPWFIYSAVRYGREFWQVLVADHVVTRMTKFVDPAHVQPWHYYLTTLYAEIVRNSTLVPILIGTVLLAIEGIRRRWYLGGLIVLWFVVPLVAISLGTSKLYHYLYPFLPPLAIGAGYFAFMVLGRASPVRRGFEHTGERISNNQWAARVRDRVPQLRQIALVLGAVALIVTFITLAIGRFGIHAGDVTVLRNSSVGRPLAAAVVLLVLAGRGKFAGFAVLVTLFILMLRPVASYRWTIDHLNDRDDVLRVAAACLAGRMPLHDRPGVHLHMEDIGPWRYIYYLRSVGWQHPPQRTDAVLREKLFEDGRQQPILIGTSELSRFESTLPAELRVRLSQTPRVAFARDALHLLLPGRYGACASGQAL